MSSDRKRSGDVHVDAGAAGSIKRSKGKEPPSVLDTLTSRIEFLARNQLHLSSSSATSRTTEYLRFMKLKAVHDEPDKPSELAPSFKVDELLSKHLLDTRSYTMLETYLLGEGGRIHHNPVLEEQPHYAERLKKTLGLYRDTFLSAPPSEIWDDGAAEANVVGDVDSASGSSGSDAEDEATTYKCRISRDNSIIEVSVRSTDTLWDLKKKIEEEHHGMDADRQMITFDGRQLANADTLGDRSASTLKLILIPGYFYTLFIKSYTGETFPIHLVAHNDTVGNLKESIEDIEGHFMDPFRLVYAGKSLQDGHTLVDCGVKDDATLEIVHYQEAKLLPTM